MRKSTLFFSREYVLVLQKDSWEKSARITSHHAAFICAKKGGKGEARERGEARISPVPSSLFPRSFLASSLILEALFCL